MPLAARSWRPSRARHSNAMTGGGQVLSPSEATEVEDGGNGAVLGKNNGKSAMTGSSKRAIGGAPHGASSPPLRSLTMGSPRRRADLRSIQQFERQIADLRALNKDTVMDLPHIDGEPPWRQHSAQQRNH
eukprot:459947-Amphidinium_carterae.1